VVYYRGETTAEPYMIGPPGHALGKSLVLLRLLGDSKGLSFAPAGSRPLDLQRDQVLVLPSQLEVRHLSGSQHCSFIAMSYKSERKNVLSEHFESENMRVIPFMRNRH
jgi:hypothetical protein